MLTGQSVVVSNFHDTLLLVIETTVSQRFQLPDEESFLVASGASLLVLLVQLHNPRNQRRFDEGIRAA